MVASLALSVLSPNRTGVQLVLWNLRTQKLLEIDIEMAQIDFGLQNKFVCFSK